MKHDWLIWLSAIAMIILTTGLAFSNTTNTVSSTVTGTTTVLVTTSNTAGSAADHVYIGIVVFGD